MISNFRTYDLSVQFFRRCKGISLPEYLKHQLLRASSSIVLNLAEGSGKPTIKDRKRFYFIALASLRECQAIIDISAGFDPDVMVLSDSLGAHLYRLCHSQAFMEKGGEKR